MKSHISIMSKEGSQTIKAYADDLEQEMKKEKTLNFIQKTVASIFDV